MNSRPPVPQTGALTELRYAPSHFGPWIYRSEARHKARKSIPALVLSLHEDLVARFEFVQHRTQSFRIRTAGRV